MHIGIVVLFSQQPHFEIISMFLQNQQPELSISIRKVTLLHSQRNNADIMAEFRYAFYNGEYRKGLQRYEQLYCDSQAVINALDNFQIN